MQPKREAQGRQGRGTLGRRSRTDTRALTVLHGHGGPPDGKALRTLYDLLGASPSDDAEGLRSAFRNAVKANHPDLHPHDPGATLRLSGIVRAYAILRDAQERASYDYALRVETGPLCAKPKRAFVHKVRLVLSEAVAVSTMAVVLGGGFALFGHVVTQVSNDQKTAELVGPQIAPVERAGAEPASSEREAPHGKLASVAVPNIEIAPSAPAAVADPPLRLPEREAAKVTEDSSATGQPDFKPGRFKRSARLQQPDQGPVAGPSVQPPVRIELSSLENNNISKPPSPEIAIPDQKDRARQSHASAKPTEVTPHEKQRATAARPPAIHSPVKQALLEGKIAPAPCSQSCPGSNLSPLLGVGF
jgi:curved DNA-binding protein CbpA